MPRLRHTVEQILAKLREAEVALSKGQAVAQVCRGLSITEQTYYRWKKEYGGLRVDQAKRLKGLEQENARLKRLVADLSLDNSILKEGQRETSKPGPTPRRGPACPGHDLGVRTPGLPRGGTLSSHATVCTHPNG